MQASVANALCWIENDLSDATSAEDSSIASFEDLMATKTKEINLLTTAIETKSTRLADLGVEIASMKNDLEDTVEALAEDKKFIADLKTRCATETKKWEALSLEDAMQAAGLPATVCQTPDGSRSSCQGRLIENLPLVVFEQVFYVVFILEILSIWMILMF